jgi:hypothetical protein
LPTPAEDLVDFVMVWWFGRAKCEAKAVAQTEGCGLFYAAWAEGFECADFENEAGFVDVEIYRKIGQYGWVEGLRVGQCLVWK